MECLLCLDSYQSAADGIERNSKTWKELDIQSIIEKHLWPMFLLKTESQWICNSCWNIVLDFHKFYVRIETAHECLMKLEPDHADLACAYNNYKEFVAENLLEPEITIDPANIVVKQENDESEFEAPDDKNDEDNIPLIEIQKAIDVIGKSVNRNNALCTGDPLEDIENSKIIETTPSNSNIVDNALSKTRRRNTRKSKDSEDNCFEDPLTESLDETKCSKQRATKRCAYNIAKIRSSTKTCIRKQSKLECYNHQGDSKKPVVSQELGSPVCFLRPDAAAATPFARFYHQSKINCRDYDSFTLEYFQLGCDVCRQTFVKFTELQKHYEETHNVKGYALCCDKKYYRHSLLVDHICFHLNPDYFKCQLCSELLTLRKSYKAHMKIHEDQFVCDVCKKRFMRKDLLDNHRLIHLSDEEKKYHCTVCNKLFASEPMLTNHQKVVHLKKYAKLCDICGEYKRNVESLRRHMIKHEGVVAPPPLSCEVCGRLVANKRNLKIHMHSQHPAEKKDFICPVCQKKSPNAKALRQHVRVNHETGYIHKCSICDKAFKRRENLKSHMNIHTGTDLFVCPWCPKTFNANSSMHLHRKTAHPQEWEEERRKKFSGNLPPNFKPPPTKDTQNTSYPLQYNF